MEKQPADVLVITPHPDDAEFGAAGSVAKMVREGKTVVYVVVTNGDKGSSDPDLDPAELVRIPDSPTGPYLARELARHAAPSATPTRRGRKTRKKVVR